VQVIGATQHSFYTLGYIFGFFTRHLKNLLGVFWRHLISRKIPPRKVKECYAISLTIGDLRFMSRCKNHPPHMMYALCMFRLMIIFISYFMIGWSSQFMDIPKTHAKLSYCLVLGPLFWECPDLRVLPYMLYTTLNLLIIFFTSTINQWILKTISRLYKILINWAISM
jgi:hypothetical protein